MPESSITSHIIHFLMFFGPCFAIVISIGQLMRTRKDRVDYIFSSSFFGMGLWMLQICLYSTGVLNGYPSIYGITTMMIPLSFIAPPLMVLRYKWIISRSFHLRPRHILLFLPGLLAAGVLLVPVIYPGIPAPDRTFPGLPVMNGPFRGLHPYYQLVYTMFFLPNVYLVLFMFPVLVKMAVVWKKFPSPHQSSASRMGYVFAGVIVFSNVVCIVGNFVSFEVVKASILMANCATIMVYLVTQRNPDYLRLLQSETRKAHYEKSRLKGVDIEAVITRLYEIMEDEKAFADEELSISRVADELGINLHQLSEILNEKIRKNFKTFVNEYRVAEAKKLLVEEPERSVLSIGVAVGFNSNTTFCTVFSRLTGLSPSQYRRLNIC